MKTSRSWVYVDNLLPSCYIIKCQAGVDIE